MLDKVFYKLAKPIMASYRRLNAVTRGVLDVLVCAFDRYGQGRGPQAAASMAYYFMFSLFPLLLLLVSLGSTLLEGQDIQTIIADRVAEAIPGAEELILDNIDKVLAARGTVNILSAISLLWSASGMFSVLSFSVNGFWPKAEATNFVITRLAGLAFVALLFIMLVASTVAGAVFDLLLQAGQQYGMENFVQAGSMLWWVVSALGPWFFRFLLFFILFRWIPTAKVKASAAVVGAIVAAVGWDLTTTLFAWFLSSGIINYSVIYGSLGAILGLLFWIYLVSSVIFMSAALTSAIDRPPETPLSEQSAEEIRSLF